MLRSAGMLWMLLWLPWAGAIAQTVYTLDIHEGQVVLNGQPLSGDQLPASLEDAALQARFNFSFTGTEPPVVELDGRYYRIEVDRLVEVDAAEAEQAVSVFFRGQRGLEPVLPSMDPVAGPFAANAPMRAAREQALTLAGQQAQVLQQQAVALEALSRDLEQAQARMATQLEDGRARVAPRLEEVQARMAQQAHQMAAVAAQLPQLEVQDYLRAVQVADAQLFERLEAEQRLEAETHVLAERIRQLTPGRDRSVLEKDLREKLEEIFELKQANRRREIQYLEQQLEQLRGRLQERERLHDKIIDRRFRELIGRP